jgi:hypothetical protein
MKVAITSNLNGIGLHADADLLCQWLVERDHEVTVIQYDAPMPTEEYDLGICLEVVAFPSGAKRLWYIANPEWLLPAYLRPIQKSFEKVLAKTRDAERVLRERFSGVTYIGFLSKDKRDLSIPREHKFLHLGGNSGFRNTPAVIEAWRSYRYWNGLDAANAPLTVVSNSKMVVCEKTPDVTFVQRTTDEEIARLQNSHLFHVMPSAYEGYGQALHESQSVGAVLLTTDAGPMAELKAPFEVGSFRQKRNNMGTLYEVSPQAIREKIPVMLSQPNHVLARMQVEARARWENGNKEFTERFEELLKPRVASDKPRLAIIGNFDPPHSTENDLLWTLRDMGYSVTPFQENRDTTETILDDCNRVGVKLLIYVHTHGWTTPGKMTLDHLIIKLREAGIKTCSFHLDRYWGLNALDQREDRIGAHPMWRTDCIFTADGGSPQRFKERNINHFWLPPGVIRRDCFNDSRQSDLSVEVGFVGATSYHPEYTFRCELLEFLRQAYGDRFRIFQGYRGARLNSLYASIRVCVGDSCFAGADNYWSDRCPETLGRGGFLIHPETKGLRIPGLVTFEPGNLHELQDRIDWFLDHEEERQACIKVASAWVRENETYHNRMSVLLREMGL